MNTAFADSASWALILGILTPLLVSVVQQPKWSPRTRALVSAALAVVVGVLTVAANGGFDTGSGQTTIGVIALVLVASNTAYKTLWKPTGVAGTIEGATSPKPQPDPLPSDPDGTSAANVDDTPATPGGPQPPAY